MKKKLVSVFVFTLVSGVLFLPVENIHARAGYKKVIKGVGNIIFSSTAIGKGKEHTVVLKTSFKKGEKIYARGYFPGKIGRFSRGEEFYTDLWINGKFRKRVTWSGKNVPDAHWKQTQTYVYKTGDDDFKNNPLNDLSSGTYRVMILLSRSKYMGTKKVFKNGAWYKEKVYKPVNLSRGEFTFIVE